MLEVLSASAKNAVGSLLDLIQDRGFTGYTLVHFQSDMILLGCVYAGDLLAG